MAKKVDTFSLMATYEKQSSENYYIFVDLFHDADWYSFVQPLLASPGVQNFCI